MRLDLPKDGAAGLPGDVRHALKDVTTQLALRHGLDQITWKAATEYGFQFKLQRLALQLLVNLFGLTAKFLDLTLHAGNL